MEHQTLTMKSLLSLSGGSKDADVSVVDDANLFADEEILQDSTDTDVSIAVDVMDVEEITIPAIVDTYGRLSDRVEALEHETGLSVIPLTMANIAPEVESLSRHEIFEFNGERYAMSSKVRDQVINNWQEKVIANLSSGLAFEEGLVINVEYRGILYKTLSLSKNEWTLLLSKFRLFKQSLVIRNRSNIIMTIKAEHATR